MTVPKTSYSSCHPLIRLHMKTFTHTQRMGLSTVQQDIIWLFTMEVGHHSAPSRFLLGRQMRRRGGATCYLGDGWGRRSSGGGEGEAGTPWCKQCTLLFISLKLFPYGANPFFRCFSLRACYHRRVHKQLKKWGGSPGFSGLFCPFVWRPFFLAGTASSCIFLLVVWHQFRSLHLY